MGACSLSYKIAVASSDGERIDETFGSARSFLIYEVTDGVYQKTEERAVQPDPACSDAGSVQSGCSSSGGCGANGCGNGAGCGGQSAVSSKVELISDCRCIVCKKIGFHIQKQLERKAISAFDVLCSVEEALNKITMYYRRIDNHESLRRQK